MWVGKSSEKVWVPYTYGFIMLATRSSGRFTPALYYWERRNIFSEPSKAFMCICGAAYMPTPLPTKPPGHLPGGSLTMQCLLCFLPGIPGVPEKTYYPVSFKSAQALKAPPWGNAHGAHSFQLLALTEGWDDEWKLSVMHCFFSRLRALPPRPQPTGYVLGSLSTPGCNWNKLVAWWRNLWNLLWMIYFRIESLVCILNVVFHGYVFLYFIGKYELHLNMLALILKRIR